MVSVTAPRASARGTEAPPVSGSPVRNNGASPAAPGRKRAAVGGGGVGGGQRGAAGHGLAGGGGEGEGGAVGGSDQVAEGVDDDVVGSAEQDQVAEPGGAALGPRDDVVDVGAPGVAAGELA